MNLWLLWFDIGLAMPLLAAGAWLAFFREREPPSAAADRRDLVSRYADPDLRWPKPRLGRRTWGVWVRIR